MPRSKKVLKEVVQQIDEMFRKSKESCIPASLFHESINTSKLTLGRARKLLHIKTQRARPRPESPYITLWYRGTRSLTAALREIEKEERQQTEARPASSALSDCAHMVESFMTAEGTHYEVKGTDVVAALHVLRGRRTVLKAKNSLGIRSIKRKDGWYWLWPAQEIQDWLENLLVHGPQERSDIYKQAAEKKWSKDSVDFARYKLGHGNIIQYYSPEKGWVWRQV
jgi:hypothetical protein